MASGDTTSHWSDPLASGEERERFVELLQYHFAEGRLESEDFEQRMHAVLSATTLGELYRICADLPALPPVTHRPRRRRR